MRRAAPACVVLAMLLSCSNGQQEHAKPATDAASTRATDEPLQAASRPGELAAPVQAAAKPGGATAVPDACRYDGLDKQLSAARAQWQGTGINSYSMTVQRASFHQRAAWPNSWPLKLVVRDGHATGNLPRVDQAWLQSVTVDGLFDYIETEAAKHPDCLNVAFDPTFGFPTSIRIDPVFGGADDELEYSISDFGP